jgi:predicted transposase/invertase (TIGR01784 family)
MILGIDPKVDYAFKHLFGREKTLPLLSNLIDEVLAPSRGHCTYDLDLLNPFNPKDSFDDKLSILDIKARDQTGQQFNIEMQMLVYPHYDKRILFYASTLHQEQLKEGEGYENLRPTISISFLNHIWFPATTVYHTRFRLLEESGHFPLTDDLEFHVLELPKFTKSATELASGLDIWLYFLRHAERIDSVAVPMPLRQPLVLRAMEELKMLTQSEIERERYLARRKAQFDYNTLVNWARKEGRQEGRQEGLINRIHFCERLLHRPATDAAVLTLLSIEELDKLAEDLESQVQKQQGLQPQ